MNSRNFLGYGIILCILLILGGYTQWNVSDLFSPGKWGPRGPNSYHK
ncbi:MAG TPA: hypothetical protein PK079_07905 [Leptospiraceae bacterium]|nr:hypothetical protein [Leptospiraceae bacterium]HMW07390.1 hypothetical protein [Leptospiraceae bacterium]HMX34233.1 hypothetical protein [Leptospiraceae bacterium]HMY32454.1 hypothetical protein [Leptospiraceae bacterium]HMZ64209.1 hypothetical protein [Leptospiraceae bacterium]